jgi:hypothetical protein
MSPAVSFYSWLHLQLLAAQSGTGENVGELQAYKEGLVWTGFFHSSRTPLFGQKPAFLTGSQPCPNRTDKVIKVSSPYSCREPHGTEAPSHTSSPYSWKVGCLWVKFCFFSYGVKDFTILKSLSRKLLRQFLVRWRSSLWFAHSSVTYNKTKTRRGWPAKPSPTPKSVQRMCEREVLDGSIPLKCNVYI